VGSVISYTRANRSCLEQRAEQGAERVGCRSGGLRTAHGCREDEKGVAAAEFVGRTVGDRCPDGGGGGEDGFCCGR